MRPGYLCAALTAAIGFIGCGSEPETEQRRELTVFHLDKDGRPDKSTIRKMMLAPEELTTFRRASSERNPALMEGLSALRGIATSSGYAYTWDCRMDLSVFGGEVKVLKSDVWNDGCLGFGAGAYNVMQISLPDFYWPGAGGLIFDIWNAHGKGADSTGTHHNDTCFYQNASGGNPSLRRPTSLQELACWDPYAPGAEFFVGLGTVTKSFEHIRRCAADGQPGFTCP